MSGTQPGRKEGTSTTKITMGVQRIASRYAKSLIDLSIERGNLERVLADIEVLRAASRSRDFMLMLKSPVVKADKKQQIVHALFRHKFDDLTVAFLDILFRKGREAHILDIATSFEEQFKRHKGITSVRVRTATDLDPAVVGQIRDILQASPVTSATVELSVEVDPELIGGFVIELDDRLYDASIQHKLALLRKEFKDNLYISQVIAQ